MNVNPLLGYPSTSSPAGVQHKPTFYHMEITLSAKEFHDMSKRSFDTAARCKGEAKEYNKQRWDKSDMEPNFKEGDQVL
ncbi:hypothetical protein O181_009008 [Austropuccinia psidii MF-1]|uniref:Uncharacterized protein n=1 Tax=Austropuccinia psidii MF-1 TaxID=1389203 RepID=A0A9Q3BQ92_9BASI|nr:hypothetical protein [Austropuccinia psidii MF-1]